MEQPQYSKGSRKRGNAVQETFTNFGVLLTVLRLHAAETTVFWIFFLYERFASRYKFRTIVETLFLARLFAFSEEHLVFAGRG